MDQSNEFGAQSDMLTVDLSTDMGKSDGAKAVLTGRTVFQ
jgi:hypothetical protein